MLQGRQFILTKRLMRAKGFSKKLKYPEEEECLWFFSDQKNFHWDEKVNPRNNRWPCADPTQVPTVMHAHEVFINSKVLNFFPRNLRDNVETDAYVEALRTIFKPSWTDGVDRAGRLCVFQQDSAPSYKALKTQDWMDSKEFSSSCHTKLLMAP
ncbi:hypothetical protein ACTXT7_015482 [Hymenolepis weldensis]